MYADLKPSTPSAAVMPPPIDDNVQYTLVVHAQNTAKDLPLYPAGITSDYHLSVTLLLL